MSGDRTLLEMRDLSFSYNFSFFFKKKVILHSISYTVKSGSVIALRGANGSGKSTFLKLCAGLLLPTSGKIFHASLNIAYVGHECALPTFLTPYQILYYVLRLRKKNFSAKHIFSFLELVHLENEAYDQLSTFSFGMRQRIMIAQALAQEPHLLLLDEPFSGIESSLRNSIEKMCLNRSINRTVIYICHDQLAYERDYDIILSNGRLSVIYSSCEKESFDYIRTGN